MGTTRYKVTYNCQCGEDYGSCDKRSFFLFAYNRSCDVGTLYHKLHADLPQSKLEKLGAFGDEAISALVTVLTQQDPSEKWDDNDILEVKNN